MNPNLKAIKRLALEIKDAGVVPLIIVHGGGGFGHWWAAKYQLKDGYEYPSQIMGFSKTHQAMTSLNKLFVDSLINYEIPAVGVQPSSCMITKSGRINIIEERPLKRLVKLGFVPVLYGNAVTDLETGFSILSGDQLVSSLAIRLNVDHILMGIDVDGLYTADPKIDPSAHLIQHITLGELKKLQHRIEGAKVTDVTGGMRGKITEIILAIEQGIRVLFVNATKPGNIYKALKGEEVVGTIIEKELN